MKVNTLHLMMKAANLPASNIFEQMMSGKPLLNCDEVSTQINLLEDALQRKEDWLETISDNNPSLTEALKEFVDKVSSNYRELLFNHTKSVNVAKEVIK